MKKRKNSRAKGARGELELAKFLEAKGFSARRGQQFAGGSDSPDVICPDLNGYHIECKRVESLNLYKAMAQSIKDANGKKIPLVIHRKNDQDWVAIIRLEDLLNQFLYTGR